MRVSIMNKLSYHEGNNHIVLQGGISDGVWNDAIKDYTKNAFMEVTIWSHPDHEGTLGSSNRIRERIKEAFKDRE